MNEWVKQVTEFQKAFELPRLTREDIVMHRTILLHEEFSEFVQASKDVVEGKTEKDQKDGLVDMLDALGDMIVIIIGTANLLGLDIDTAMKRIHESNMSKLGADGKPEFKENGKVAKGPNFFKPKLKDLVSDDKALEFISDVIERRLKDGSVDKFIKDFGEKKSDKEDEDVKKGMEKFVEKLNNVLYGGEETGKEETCKCHKDKPKKKKDCECTKKSLHIVFTEKDKIDDEDSKLTTYAIKGMPAKCPFCGGKAIGVKMSHGEDETFCLSCEDCHAKTRFEPNFEEAITDWLSRYDEDDE